MKKFLQNNIYIYVITGIIFVFLIYFLLSLFANDSLNYPIFPSFKEIAESTFNLLSEKRYLVSIGWTFFRILLALIISILSSVIIGYLYVLFKGIYYIFKPFLFLFKVAPVAAIIIYLLIGFGSTTTIYIISLLVMIPLMVEALIASIDNIDNSIKEELALLECNSFIKYFYVYLPIIMPYLIMSIIQSCSLGLKVVVMSEYLCITPNSIGNILNSFYSAIDMAGIMAVMIVLIIIALIIEALIVFYKRKMNSIYNNF